MLRSRTRRAGEDVMGRRFNFCSAASLVVCIGISSLGLRSYFRTDDLTSYSGHSLNNVTSDKGKLFWFFDRIGGHAPTFQWSYACYGSDVSEARNPYYYWRTWPSLFQQHWAGYGFAAAVTHSSPGKSRIQTCMLSVPHALFAMIAAILPLGRIRR